MRGECIGDAVITIGTPLLKQLITPTLSKLDLNTWKKEAKAEIEARITEQEGKMKRARTEHMAEFWARDIQENKEQLEALNSL